MFIIPINNQYNIIAAILEILIESYKNSRVINYLQDVPLGCSSNDTKVEFSQGQSGLGWGIIP